MDQRTRKRNTLQWVSVLPRLRIGYFLTAQPREFPTHDLAVSVILGAHSIRRESRPLEGTGTDQREPIVTRPRLGEVLYFLECPARPPL